MLMHRAAKGRGRVVAAHVRCARVLEGAAAGRSIAEPVNWRALISMGDVSVDGCELELRAWMQ